VCRKEGERKGEGRENRKTKTENSGEREEK
jgi:hypothetical protein